MKSRNREIVKSCFHEIVFSENGVVKKSGVVRNLGGSEIWVGQKSGVVPNLVGSEIGVRSPKWGSGLQNGVRSPKWGSDLQNGGPEVQNGV